MLVAYCRHALRGHAARPFFLRPLSNSGLVQDGFSYSYSSIAGTVKEYQHHIFVNIPQSASGWPSLIERHPKVLSVFKTLAILKSRLKESTVKVTAYDVVGVDQKLLMTSEKSDSTLDVMIFPIGLRYVNLPEELLENALMRGLLSETEQTATGKQANLYSNQQADRQLDRYEEDVSRKLHLFVCCHGARDRRCGERGTPLAARLHQLVKHKGLLDKIAVCQSSHVGGHAYAGNLLVYGSSHPADGDWFGCLSSNDATQVLDGLLDMVVGSDGGVEGSLREAWRGRVGLSRTEQIDLWSAGGEVVDFQSDSEDDVDGSC